MRPDLDTYFISMAKLVSLRSTCVRRRVGCILVDKFRHVLATGYNGVASGLEHCIDNPCPGAKYKSGEGLEHCQAIHAEQNALLQCKDTQAIETAYITTSPCWTCVKLLLNTGCKGIVFAEEYSDWLRPYNLWTGNKAGNRRWQLHNTAIQYDTTIQFVPAKK